MSEQTINELARRLSVAGFLVTIDLEVEAAGAAAILNLSPKTLRNMRSTLDGPSWRTVRGLVWYRIAAVLEWHGTSVSFTPAQPGAHPDAATIAR